MARWLGRLIHRVVDWLDGGDGSSVIEYESVSWHSLMGIRHQNAATDETAIEAAIQGKSLSAPRLTPNAIDSVIVSEQYYVFPDTTLTVCCLTLENGFSVIGHSAAASSENFDADIGRHVARTEARNNIWQLEGYLLRQRLHDQAISQALARGGSA